MQINSFEKDQIIKIMNLYENRLLKTKKKLWNFDFEKERPIKVCVTISKFAGLLQRLTLQKKKINRRG